MSRIAVFGGTGYLASIIKYQNRKKTNTYTFFSRKKKDKNYINFSSYKKNLNTLKGYDFIIHLAGPNQNQLKKNKRLLQKKNQMTAKICDLCLANNIKLIYLSSLQVYKDYGKKNILINSSLNQSNSYSKLHLESEKIIISKFSNQKKKFIILRMGNVFGLNKFSNIRNIESNLIHKLCFNVVKKKNILINNGSIQRTFIPSKIFIKVINLILKKNLFNNSIENFCYKNLSIKEIASMIQKRSILLFKFKPNLIIKNFKKFSLFKTHVNKNFKFNLNNKNLHFEIDQTLEHIKKMINLENKKDKKFKKF